MLQDCQLQQVVWGCRISVAIVGTGVQNFCGTRQNVLQNFCGTSWYGLQNFCGTSQYGVQNFCGTSQYGVQNFCGTSQSGVQNFCGTSQCGVKNFCGTSQCGVQNFCGSSQCGVQNLLILKNPDLSDNCAYKRNSRICSLNARTVFTKSVTSQFLKSYQTKSNKIKDKTLVTYIDTVVNFMKNLSGILFRLSNDLVPVFTFHLDKRFLPFPCRVSLRYSKQTKSDYL